MFGNTEAITVGMARLALDAASLRHQAISHNIANANSPGFAPLRVSFEDQMGAARSALREGAPIEHSMLAQVQPVLTRGAPAQGADRTALLDLEVADMAQNTVQYQALLRALGKHMALLSAAVNEGRR